MESHDLKPEDRALCVLPLYHINGLINTMMGPLVSGSSVFMPPKLRLQSFGAGFSSIVVPGSALYQLFFQHCCIKQNFQGIKSK